MDETSCNHVEIFHDRPERECWEVRERTDNEHNEDKPYDKKRAVIAERPVADRDDLLDNKRSRERNCNDSDRVPADKHCKSCRKIIEDTVSRQTSERTAVILRS